MDREFSFSDLGRVQWGSTVKLTLTRGFFAGLVWAIIIGASQGADISFLARPFIWAIIAAPLALVLQLIGMIIGAFMTLLGLWFRFIASLTICIGDPIVYLINRFFPAFLNIADLGIFNFQPMIFITYPD